MKAGIMRRTALGALGAGALLPLAGCGGGGSSAGSDGTSSNTSGNTSGSTTTTDTAAGWPWSGTTTTAVVPTLDDFVTVLASGSLSYRFQVSAISTTIDPLTGVAADTGTVAALVPYRMSKYLVTNAHWRAFCNDTQDRYLPSTSRTAGRYWAGGANG